MNPFSSNTRILGICQEAILTASKYLEIYLYDIEVLFPAMIDDFDKMPYKIRWRAFLNDGNGDKEKQTVGGYANWPEEPNEKQVGLTLKRSATFSTLTATMAGGQYVYQALDAWKYDQESFQIAVYKQTIVQSMAGMVDDATLTMPSLGKIQSFVIKELQKESVGFLSEIHSKMTADLDHQRKMDRLDP